MTTKRCTRCELTKDETEFSLSKGKRGSWCRACIAEHNKARLESDPHFRVRKGKFSDARNAATRKLVAAHRDEFERLYEAEKKQRGL